MACPLAAERIWTEKSLFNDAERKYYEGGNKTVTTLHSIQSNQSMFYACVGLYISLLFLLKFQLN